MDRFPSETSWDVRGIDNKVMYSGAGYLNPHQEYKEVMCLEDHCHTFTIYDSGMDGICCLFGKGHYSLRVDGDDVLCTDPDFKRSNSHNIGCNRKKKKLLNLLVTSTFTGNFRKKTSGANR